MSKFKANVKALPLFWLAKRKVARDKYRQAIEALGPKTGQPTANTGETVLVFSSMGIFADQLVVDTVLARQLEEQGAKVVVVLCDAQLPACHVADRYSYAFAAGAQGRAGRQQRLCRNCVGATDELRQGSGLTYATFSEGLAHATTMGIPGSGLDVSDEINSGVIRFAASSHPSVLDAVPGDVRQAYQHGADIALRAIEGLFDKYRPTRVIAHHGIYLPQGIVQKVAHRRGALFYSWHFGYRKSTLIFSRGDTYHRELTAEQPAAFEKPLAESERARILQYLQSRISGGQDWIHFNRTPTAFASADPGRPYFVCYTSVDWDAALHFPASVFSSQFDFLRALADVFRECPEADLVIRVHPAEVTGFHPAALSAEDFLRTLQLPPNVRVISAHDPTSSYDLAKGCTAAIVYNTKLGIELPPFGIPVIVGGDCWIRNKGFSYDVKAREDLAALVKLGRKLAVTDAQRERALQFAHYFYYRRCVATPELTSTGPKFHVRVEAAGLRERERSGGGTAFIAAKILRGEHVQVP